MPGFTDPVFDAQATFRALLEAMSMPGSLRRLPATPVPEGVAPALMSICLALLDADTRLWLDATARRAGLGRHLAFHCGCVLTDDPGSAHFALALAASELPPLDDFALGTDECPESATTLLVQVQRLGADATWRVRGPGVNGERGFAVDGLPASFHSELAANAARYPCGVDVVLACGRDVIALPRTARLEV